MKRDSYSDGGDMKQLQCNISTRTVQAANSTCASRVTLVTIRDVYTCPSVQYLQFGLKVKQDSNDIT